MGDLTKPRRAWVVCVLLFAGCYGCDNDSAPITADSDGGVDAGSPMDGAAPRDAGRADGGLVDAGPDASGDAGSELPRVIARDELGCPGGDCRGWPANSEGSVWRYLIEVEDRVARTTRVRSFVLFVPVHSDDDLPLVVVLHGGTSEGGEQGIAGFSWDELAGPRGAGRWQKNTPSCRMLPHEGGLPEFTADGTASAAPCRPPGVTYTNALRFAVAYAEGVIDPDSTDERHWEDGRVPSPGWGSSEEQRDDVGYIDALLDVLLRDNALFRVDRGRMYVTGGSNGGMMVQRLVCSLREETPHLWQVAAFASNIGALPEPLADGLEGRPRCPDELGRDIGLRVSMGTGIDTPNCNSPACRRPTVTGDGTMPFGEMGDVHYVNSPDRGRVVSGPDTFSRWHRALELRGAHVREVEAVGFFTTIDRTTAGVSTVETVLTEGGSHSFAGLRGDLTHVASTWAFLSSFVRDPDGTLRRVEPEWMSGEY